MNARSYQQSLTNRGIDGSSSCGLTVCTPGSGIGLVPGTHADDVQLWLRCAPLFERPFLPGADVACFVQVAETAGLLSRSAPWTESCFNSRLAFELATFDQKSQVQSVKPIRFEVAVDGVPGLRVDAAVGDALFEVLVDLRDVRRFRASLLSAAQLAARADARRVVIVLDEPRVTDERLREEWEGAASAVRPELTARLVLAIRRGGQWTSHPGPLAAAELDALQEIVKHERSRQPARSTRGSEAHYEILRILVHHWLLERGPISVAELMAISGTSHPTVARAIKRLEHCLTRHSDRSVELRFFPRDEWARLVALSDEIRSTVRFADRSGQARSPESLLRRLRRLGRQDIAIGGVSGAMHYQASLDLVGNARLDLSVHAPGKELDLSFVEQLDPALTPTTARDAGAVLVVHAVRRAVPLFERDGEGAPYADPVECLLDLHDARLEEQALGFLQSFPVARGQSL